MSSKKNSKMRIRMGSNSKPPSPVVDPVNPMPAMAFVAKSTNKFKNMLEKERSLTVKERFDIFISETSFTALTKIFKGGNIFKQIIWLVLTLAMMSWLCIQCYWLIEKYLAYPYEVKIELKSRPKMDFPSVTVCNRNPIKASKFKESPFYAYQDIFSCTKDSSLYDSAVGMAKDRSNSTTEGDHGSGEMDDYNMLINQSFSVWSALDDPTTAENFYKTEDGESKATMLYSVVAAAIDRDDLKSYGHQIEDFLIACRYNGKQCSPHNFTYVYNVKYGNCFTFNAFNNSQPELSTTYAGPLMGLALELNIQQNEYLPIFAPDAGVRVMVHSRGTFPALEDDGFSIPVGFVTSVGIKMTEITRLPPPHANCATKGKIDNVYQQRYGVKYEKSTCTKTCQQNRWFEKCGCVLSLYEAPDGANICDLYSADADACLWRESFNMEECETLCPNPCFEEKIDPLISMGTWPSDKYEDYLDFKLMHTSLDFMKTNEKPESEENVAKLEVYFRELVVQEIEQQKAYESQNLISDIGGQLGLWLGLSAITIGEVFEFFMAVFKAVTSKAVRRRTRESAIHSLENDRRLSLQEFR